MTPTDAALPSVPSGTVLGYPIDLGSIESLLHHLQVMMQQGQPVHVVTLNPEMIMRGEQTPAFGQLLKHADLRLADGAGVVWALKRQGYPGVTRVAGIEFSEALLAHAAQSGQGVALIGASEDVNAEAAKRLSERFSGLKVVYRHHGFFDSPEAARACAEAASRAGAAYVLVAMGVPHQEQWIHTYKGLFPTPAAFVGIGGSFDVWSGQKQRAHPLFRALNLEWLWRVASEPWRIQRLAKTLPMFVVKVLVHRPVS